MLEFISLGFKSDRFKTLMSSLGIIIGVLAIVVMLSVGEGLYSGVSSQFSTLDLDVIHVIPGSARFGWPDGEPGSRNAAEPAKFTDKDTKVLENVVGDERGNLDLDDNSLTENTRACYPIEFIPNTQPKGMGAVPKNVVMLTADAFGVLPPIAKLTPAQALKRTV